MAERDRPRLELEKAIKDARIAVHEVVTGTRMETYHARTVTGVATNPTGIEAKIREEEVARRRSKDR